MLYNNQYKYIKGKIYIMKIDHNYTIQHSLLTREVFIMIVIDILKLTYFSKKRLYEIVMKPAHKKIEKRDQRLRIPPLRGRNLFYITQMKNS